MMNSTIPLPRSLAQTAFWEWPEGATLPMEFIYGLLGLIAVVATIWLTIRVVRRALAEARPTLLYFGIAGRLGLRPAQRWALWRVARHAGLGSPLTLLMSGATFDHHAGAYLDGQADHRAVRLAATLADARRRLFED